MVLLRSLALGLLSLRALAVPDIETAEEEVEDPSSTPNLKVGVSVSFPQSEIFGVKLVNGHPTKALLSFDNAEKDPVKVTFIGGSLWTQAYGEDSPASHIIRNLTAKSYNVEIPALDKKSIEYSFAQELHPQDLILNLAAVLQDKSNQFYTVQVYNQTVSVVEAPTSIFDPQVIFLYLVLAAAFAGTSYFIYNTWISTFFPQQKRSRRTDGKGERRKKVEPTTPAGTADSDGVATTTGSKAAYDQSWIPAHHIQRPDAKRARSGTPKGAKSKSQTA